VKGDRRDGECNSLRNRERASGWSLFKLDRERQAAINVVTAVLGEQVLIGRLEFGGRKGQLHNVISEPFH
jgi:hypothetical protein